MFNPSLPADNSPLSSAEMRSQLTALKALIDAIATITAAQIDGVSTVTPGSPATVDVTVTGNTLHFTFAIPQGETGAAGDVGPPGEVTAMQMQDALESTSSNSNSVTTMDSPFGDMDMEALREKLNELINALRR